MPTLALDRSVIVPAACSVKSKYRALLVMLEYGRLSTYARFGAEEKELAEDMAGARFGGPRIDDLVAQAADAKAALEEHLGHAPDDWVMLGSKQLLDSYGEAIRSNHSDFSLQLTAEELVALRGKLVLTCSGFVPDDRMLPIIPFTNDRPSDILLTTATTGGADLVVTEKKALQRRFTHPDSGASVVGISFEGVVEQMSTSTFELSAVNPRLW